MVQCTAVQTPTLFPPEDVLRALVVYWEYVLVPRGDV